MRNDNGGSGRPRNSLTKTPQPDQLSLETENLDSPADTPFPDGDGSIDLLPPPSVFCAGDLIEYHGEGGRMAIVAICLGHINGYYHFYTSTGKWSTVTNITTHFVVRNFVDKQALQPVIDKLPKGDLSLDTLRSMKRMNMGPDRVCGSHLLDKMHKFMLESDLVLQKHALSLENAHELVAKDGRRYVTLLEIYACVIGKAKGMKPVYPVPPHDLYAVHRSVLGNEKGFHLLGNLGDAHTWVFEVTPLEDVALIQNMQTLVRLFTDIPGKVNISLPSLTSAQLNRSQLGQFVLKARAAIDESRQFRDWTPYGMLGPSKKDRPCSPTKWTDIDMSILHFILMWAGYDQFSPTSHLHWTGSAILRATGRYRDSEYLSQTTGWTFLQEIGYITPWDFHGRYTHRLPDVQISRERGFKRLPLGPEGIRPNLTRDVFDGKRHDWAGLKAFAIDSKETVDIDDAISIEATDVPGEHWVHVHVADPASRIRHQCALGERAKLTPLTLYVSGHYTNIWGVGDEVEKLFSLAPNKPCLTFSGKVNEEGEILDYKITPGKLQEFIYMTPQDANAAVDFKDTQRPPEGSIMDEFTVGGLPPETPAGRNLTAPSELQTQDLESLKTLYQVGKNIHERRLAAGAMPSFALRVSAQASFNNTSIEHTRPGLMTCNGDPAISISWSNDFSPMVSSIMQLAGEIAARWSADRSVPIPYLTQSMAEKNLEFLKSYTEKVYYPVIRKGEEHTPQMWAQLRTLLGADELSTMPGRHFLMGVEGYAKVTSPLRRYSDLLAHWQIENALVQEMETGKVVEQKLPFTRNELEKEIFPWLRLRQRMTRQLERRSVAKGYVLQALLRAWKFAEEGAGATSRLPETFKLTVRNCVDPGNANSDSLREVAGGNLDWFQVDAQMVSEGLGKLGVDTAEIKTGDVFEVKLIDVNVHLGLVLVEATGIVKLQRDQDHANAEEVTAAKEIQGEGE